MKKLFWLFCFGAALSAGAQPHSPAYRDVLENFFRTYAFFSPTGEDELFFARKRDGWYVVIAGLVDGRVKNEQLFWSAKNGTYQNMTGFANPVHPSLLSKQLSFYLKGSANGYNYYGYERCRYYGYTNWAKDLIDDFGSATLAALPDTLLEGLGRAYADYSSRFGWYQASGREPGDEAQLTLGLLELPSAQRADSIAYNIRQSAACYTELKRRNPSYQMMVGNSAMKEFNERMHGYQQMLMAGLPEKAATFLREIPPDEPLLKWAKNYLSGCAPNAILITFGDNDTYPLWYLQETQHYRKDVAVLNESLLGYAPFVNWLRKNKSVAFSLPPEVYGAKEYQYVRYQQAKGAPAAQISPEQLLLILRTKKYKDDWYANENRATYPAKELLFRVDPLRFKKVSAQTGLGREMRFNLRDYLTLDRLMLIDIVQANLYQRPIYFSARADYAADYLQQEGLVYRLLPLNQTAKTANEDAAMKATENYLQNSLQFICGSDYAPEAIADESGEKSQYYPFAQVAEWRYKKGDRAKAAEWMAKLKTLTHNRFLPELNAYVGYVYGLTGDTGTALPILEGVAQYIYDAYRHPSALKAIEDASLAQNYLAGLSESLRLFGLASPKIKALKEALDRE